MALFNGKASLLAGLALGVGVAVVGRSAFPAIRDAARPLAKAALKSGWLFFQRTREALAELNEGVEDMVAEVQAEVETEAEAEVAAATEAAPEPATPMKAVKSPRKRVTKKQAL
ncbi:MAG TPA: DUF5132 domain-containing protein [Vicinamibacteria bacterium]|jgi:hypothetical protein